MELLYWIRNFFLSLGEKYIVPLDVLKLKVKKTKRGLVYYDYIVDGNELVVVLPEWKKSVFPYIERRNLVVNLVLSEMKEDNEFFISDIIIKS